MSDYRSPEGARWNIPDWKPSSDAPPAPAPPELASVPKMGIDVPITLADFRTHWRELAHYARLEQDDVETLTEPEFASTCERLFGYRLKLSEEQQHELNSTGWFTPVLPQVEALINALRDMAAFAKDQKRERIPNAFSVDYTVWEELHAKGLVSPHNLSQEELEQLRGINIFDDARLAISKPADLSVPLSLAEIQQHWDQLKGYCVANRRSPQKMFDDIEVVDPEKGTRHPWLDPNQRAELAARGLTYLDIHQVERMDAAGWRTSVSAKEWFDLRERGIVDEHHLPKYVVQRLVSIPFFKELWDLKFNDELIAKRRQERERDIKQRRQEREQKRAQERQERERIEQEEKQKQIEQLKAARRRRRNTWLGLLVGAVAAGSVAWLAIFRAGPPVVSIPPPPAQVAAPTPSSQAASATQPERQVKFVPIGQQLPSSSSLTQDQFDRAIKFLIESGMMPAVRSNNEGISQIVLAAHNANQANRAGIYFQQDLDKVQSAEVERAASLEYPRFDPPLAPDALRATQLNRETRKLYRSDLHRAIGMQWEAVLNAPYHREIVGNLAYFIALKGDLTSARTISVYALTLPSENATTGRSADWHMLAASSANENAEFAFDAYLVALSISRNHEGFCKSLLAQGRDFGEAVKAVVTKVFDRVQSLPIELTAAPSCATPPAF